MSWFTAASGKGGPSPKHLGSSHSMLFDAQEPLGPGAQENHEPIAIDAATRGLAWPVLAFGTL